MVMSDFRPEVEIQPFRACAMHPARIIGTVRSLWTWLWGRYHVPHFSSIYIAFLQLHAAVFKRQYRSADINMQITKLLAISTRTTK